MFKTVITMTFAILMGIATGYASSDEKPDPGDKSAPKVAKFVAYDVPAEMIEFHKWKYPKWAKNRKVVGEVWVEALVDTTGKVKDVKLTAANISQRLVSDVRRASRYNKFKPALRNERPVAMTFLFKVIFSTEKPWVTWQTMTAEEAAGELAPAPEPAKEEAKEGK